MRSFPIFKAFKLLPFVLALFAHSIDAFSTLKRPIYTRHKSNIICKLKSESVGTTKKAVLLNSKTSNFEPKRINLFQSLRGDWQNRLQPYYKKDWKCGFNSKYIPGIIFMYFACLLPTVAFGGIAIQVTGGTMGVIEYLIATGVSGMIYATLAGQPMTLIGPTGLTLAFMSALYGLTSSLSLPFLPIYSWCGIWTSCFMSLLAITGASSLIELATQFTDDVFNALLAVNFIYEASRSLIQNFQNVSNKSGAFLALNIALITYSLTGTSSQAKQTKYFNKDVRELLSNSGPVAVIFLMSLLIRLPAILNIGVEFLTVPNQIMSGRSLFSPIFSVSHRIKLISAIPALLLTSLFFLDQNITTRVVNNPKNGMVKPPAYHQDLLVLGLITGILSIFGLPWQCAATVQSLNHVRVMSMIESKQESDGSNVEVIESVCENRLSGFTIHAMVLASIASLSILKFIPMPVVSGIFLFLGRKVMTGNDFLGRIKELCMDQTLLKPTSTIKQVGYKTAFSYTLVQALMLALLWTLKSFQKTALFFPSVIGLLVLMRLFLLPKIFSQEALDALDTPVA